MNVNLEKIREIYGQSTIYDLNDNLDNVIENLSILNKYKFKNIYEMLEMNPYLFLLPSEEFEEKVEKMVKKLGVEYIEKIENNIFIWGEIE